MASLIKRYAAFAGIDGRGNGGWEDLLFRSDEREACRMRAIAYVKMGPERWAYVVDLMTGDIIDHEISLPDE